MSQHDAPLTAGFQTTGFEIDPVRVLQDAEQLAQEFAGIVGVETAERVLRESLADLGRARITEYVPMLAYRYTRERLRAIAQVEGLVTREMPEVLFVCVHNAGRSQMAAALCAHLSGGRVGVRSAGSAPAHEINPVVVAAMSEIGVDLAQAFPKPLADEVVQAADVVITMGCGDACPVYPGKRYLDWVVDDPAGQPIKVVRGIRDDIRDRVEALLHDLGIPVTSIEAP